MSFKNKQNRRFIAEWEPQSAVMIAWPHEQTDWAYMLDEVTECYIKIIELISDMLLSYKIITNFTNLFLVKQPLLRGN